jgi:hypothetical protein
MSDKYTFVVFSNPVEGREAEYNSWYEEQHLGDVLRNVHGIVAAQRFTIADTQLMGDGPEKVITNGAEAAEVPWKYLTLYEFETESALRTFQDLQAKVASGAITVEEVIDFDTLTSYLYKPAGRRQTKDAAV